MRRPCLLTQIDSYPSELRGRQRRRERYALSSRNRSPVHRQRNCRVGRALRRAGEGDFELDRGAADPARVRQASDTV